MSAALAVDYGAVGAAAYTSLRCSEEIQDLAGGVPIRHALDCITNAESSGTCFAAIARTGGRYACLEGLPEEWRTRRAVRVKVVMGFEGLGATVDLGPSGSIYSRQANANLFEICTRWHGEVQSLIDADLLKSHPVREVPGRWQGIIDGLEMLRRGEVRGQKLVVNIAKAS